MNLMTLSLRSVQTTEMDHVQKGQHVQSSILMRTCMMMTRTMNRTATSVLKGSRREVEGSDCLINANMRFVLSVFENGVQPTLRTRRKKFEEHVLYVESSHSSSFQVVITSRTGIERNK